MIKKIDINDPKAWAELDWDEESQPELLKRTDRMVNGARASRLLAQNPDWQDKIKQRTQREEYKIAHKQAIEKRNKSKLWKQSRNIFNKTKSKKVMTPDGIFNSRHEAATFYNLTPPGITRRMKSYPDQYYYVINKDD